MKKWNSGRVQERIINRLERQERQQAFERDRFFKFKLPEIQNKLSQTLLMKKVVESDKPAVVSDHILTCLKKALKSSEFDFKYFIAPIRNLVPRPNPYSLYLTQYIMEVLINDPDIIEIYGTDLEIYQIVNEVVSKINIRFEKTEEEILTQLSHNKSLVPGSRDYDIALEQLIRKKLGEPQKV
jgi:hypothetical protein